MTELSKLFQAGPLSTLSVCPGPWVPGPGCSPFSKDEVEGPAANWKESKLTIQSRSASYCLVPHLLTPGGSGPQSGPWREAGQL